MKCAEVLEKLKQGWILEKYRNLYGLPPHWQICNPKTVPNLEHHGQTILKHGTEYGVVYHQTGKKLIKLKNVKLIRTFPAETYKWVDEDVTKV
jgi:hypothetical protein